MSAGIEFECPQCGRVTRVPVELAGKQGRCGGCRKILEVPDPKMEDTARLTPHLRQSDRSAFELADSGEPLRPASERPESPGPVSERRESPRPPSERRESPAGEAPAEAAPEPEPWSFSRVPRFMWFGYLIGALLPYVAMPFAFYGIAAGHSRRVRELAAVGWLGFLPVEGFWLLQGVSKFGLFATPLIAIMFTFALAYTHATWIRQHPAPR